MDMHAQKVLIRWLPTKMLRMTRKLHKGPKWGSEVQQSAVKLVLHPRLFARALTVTTMTPDGRLVLTVGWRGAARYVGGAYQLDGAAQPPPGASQIHYFAETPTLPQLVDQAWAEHLRANPGRQQSLEDEAKALAQQLAELKDKFDREIRELEEYRAANEPNPLFDMEAFARVAHVVETAPVDPGPVLEPLEVPDLAGAIGELPEASQAFPVLPQALPPSLANLAAEAEAD